MAGQKVAQMLTGLMPQLTGLAWMVPQVLAGLRGQVCQAAVGGGGRHARVHALEVHLGVGAEVVGDVSRGASRGPRPVDSCQLTK